jgi:multidrug efflux pump
MSISTPFIERPVATTLLLVAITLAGGISYTMLPVAALPQVDFPTIQVFANLPGASPEVMAAAVATPLEKQFTRIAGITEMTSRSTVGSAQVTLQFELSRDINAAARDVQAAITASAGFLPSNLPQLPRYRKNNPADSAILLMSLESDVVPRPQLYDLASSVFAQKLSQVQGVGQVNVGGSSLPAVRVEVNPHCDAREGNRRWSLRFPRGACGTPSKKPNAREFGGRGLREVRYPRCATGLGPVCEGLHPP